METNVLGLIGTALALLVPTAFLIILYVQTASRESK
ncbi:photosystem II reaction center protein PsbM [Leptolyngbya sp. FACHB-261]|nr:photosystem II reaction center protein PsbM [Leptolyngbya sp. FACHB-261]MBD2104642.1 photosystem II reaction center protein PsbM [Leptolyngbya sp. FACHB-261]